MNLEEATAYTEKCFNGEPASCSFACPFHLPLRDFLAKCETGKWSAAYKLFRNAVFFPAVVSELCPHPCEEACQRVSVGDEPIAVGMIERACLDYVKTRKAESYAIPPKSEKIAVVGAGMAGLSFALNMALKKYEVTVFEKGEGWGGRLRPHANFKAFDEDIAFQFSAVKAEFKFNTEIKSLDELSGYDCIYLATGKDGNNFGLADSWDSSLMTTSSSKVFMGGETCGVSLMEGIAQGSECAKIVEVFLQTGKASLSHGTYSKDYCGHMLNHDGVEKKPRVNAASGSSYTEEEAMAEAGRCMKCDCALCMTSCELLKMYRKKPQKLSVETFTDSKAKPPIAPCSLTREAFSCNECGYCKSICPESVDIGALLNLARTVRVAANTQPKALHYFWLKEMEFAVGDACYHSPGEYKFMFFPGCQLSASSPGLVKASYNYLSSKYSTGIFLGCCGAPAHWAGEADMMKSNVENIKKIWEVSGKPAFVFACATCQKLFAAFMPDIPRVSLYELLAEDKDIIPEKIFDTASVFDPCASRNFDEMQSSVRYLAGKSGIELEELREKNRCCGYGGQMKNSNRKLFDEIANNRVALSDKPYIVYCANCREVFISKGKSCAHILDLVFGGGKVDDIPSLQDKRDNVIMLKKHFMKEIEHADYTPEKHDWDNIRLNVPPDVTKAMDDKLITLSDVKETVWHCESSGDKFTSNTGSVLGSMITPIIVYWVEYVPESDGSFTVVSAYSHRIHFKQEV